MSFDLRPAGDILQVDASVGGYQDRLRKRLAIAPVRERRQSVLHAIGGRDQSQDAGRKAELVDRPDGLRADGERAWRKLHQRGRLGVAEVAALLDKAVACMSSHRAECRT